MGDADIQHAENMEATQLTGISTGTTNVWSQTVQRHFCFALGCRAIMQVYQGGHMNGFHVICTVLTFVCPAFHEMTGYLVISHSK